MDIFITDNMKELPTSTVSVEDVEEWARDMGGNIRDIVEWRKGSVSFQEETIQKAHLHSVFVDELGFEKFCPDVNKRTDKKYICDRLAEIRKNHLLFFPRMGCILKNIQIAGATPSQVSDEEKTNNLIQYYRTHYNLNIDDNQHIVVYGGVSIPISELFVVKTEKVISAILKWRNIEAHLDEAEENDPSYRATINARLAAAQAIWSIKQLNEDSLFNEL